MHRYAIINTYLPEKPMKHAVGQNALEAIRMLEKKYGGDWHPANCLVRMTKARTD